MVSFLGPGKPPVGITYFAAILRDIQPCLFILKRMTLGEVRSFLIFCRE